MEVITCNKCNVNKNSSEFHKKSKQCRLCVNAKNRERRLQNPELAKQKNREKYLKSRDTELERKRAEYAENKDKYHVKNQTYHEANKEKILQRKKEYYQVNKEKILDKFNDQYKNDDEFRLKHCIRRRTREFIDKKIKYQDMIGCTHDHLVKWFEYNFLVDPDMNMSWDNFGEWQIDHVYPLSLVLQLPEDERWKYLRWENLRPVSRTYNATKYNKLIQSDIDLIKDRVIEFKMFYEDEQ